MDYKSIKYCPNCGKTLEGNPNMCSSSGCSIMPINNGYQYNNQQIPNTKKDKLSLPLLVLSAINLIGVGPFVLYFGILYFLFGGVANISAAKYYGILSSCFAYLFASLVALIVFIINKIKKGKILKLSIIIIICSFIVGYLISLLIWLK